MPVFTGQAGSSASIRLALAGFVWAKLTSNPTSGRPITARVINWATTGKESSPQWANAAGSHTLAKTVSLGR